MKRIAAIFLLFVMLIVPAAVFGDEKITDEINKAMIDVSSVIKDMVHKYDIDPDSFDLDYIHMTYTLFRYYIASQDGFSAMSTYYLRNDGSNNDNVWNKKENLGYELSKKSIYKELDKKYEEFLEEKISEKYFTEYLMLIVRNSIKLYD